MYKEGYDKTRVEIVRNILVEFEKMYKDYVEHDNREEVINICRKYSAIIGKSIYTIQGDKKELVECIDMNAEGNLIVKDSMGEIREILSGEVSIRGVKGYV